MPGPRPLLRVQPKESARKRTLGLERWLSLRQETPETVSALASFEAEGEDWEPDADGEADHDNEPGHDNEPRIC